MLRKSPAFSLIELIVVIGVVGLIATLILGGYNKTAQSYKLSLLTDDFISRLQTMRAEVKTQADPLCRGVLIDEGGLFFVESEYLNPIQKCNKIPISVEEFTDESLVVREVIVDRKDLNQLTFVFVPPVGEVFFPFEPVNANTVVEFELGLRNTEKSRKVFFVPASGKFTDANPIPNE